MTVLAKSKLTNLTANLSKWSNIEAPKILNIKTAEKSFDANWSVLTPMTGLLHFKNINVLKHLKTLCICYILRCVWKCFNTNWPAKNISSKIESVGTYLENFIKFKNNVRICFNIFWNVKAYFINDRIVLMLLKVL